MTIDISKRNNSNSVFYNLLRKHRCSLLCHPVGMAMLEHYKRIKDAGMDSLDDQKVQNALREKKMKQEAYSLDRTLRNKIAVKLESVVRERETKISSVVMETIRKHWDEGYHSVERENEEKVRGIIGGDDVTGNPDGVVRMDFQEGKALTAQLIIEFSVDTNGGEKKIGQAVDYASLTDNKRETVMLLTFHIDRIKEEQESGNTKSVLRIAQEAFLYVHNEDEDKRKVGFLWREIYEQGQESDLDFLKKSSEGLVRCLNCVATHRDNQVIHQTTTNWKVVSDNVAIYNGKVYKIFDNRFRPTYRRPDQWVPPDESKKLPWAQKLEVKTHFYMPETSELDKLDRLGYPSEGSTKRTRGGHPQSSNASQTLYPLGSVRIIEYTFVNGTHFASRASHFLQIADCIKEMHDKDVVHGDIRGFNMLHPHPEDCDMKDGISSSMLIDFDLSGEAEEDKYPPGYAERVLENYYERSGKAGELLEKSHDWRDLGSVMVEYEVDRNNMESHEILERSDEWKKIWLAFYEDGNENDNGYTLLKAFVDNHDPRMEMAERLRRSIEKGYFAGTGSPNKHLQTARGSLRTSTTCSKKI